MSINRWTVLAAVALIGAAGPAFAQGVTTGAISGIVTDPAGAGLEAVQVQVVNRSTGYSTGAITREGGHYFVQGLEVGGPYSVTARRIGFQQLTKDGYTVSLGQTTRVDFQLQTQAAVLSQVRVQGAADDIISATKTGLSTNISDSALRRLPTLDRLTD